jgi:hypothetical protein
VKYLTFLNVVIVAVVSFTANSLACSPAHYRSAKQIFKDSAHVFHGTAIRAEAVFYKNEQGSVEDIPLIKVYWKVDRTYKGKNIGKGATVTNMICGGVLVTVGAPYLVSLQALQSEEHKVPGFGDVMGILDDQGTIGEFQEPEKFTSLVAEFEQLKSKK